ncbi:Adenylyl-sulfate kinase (APS kinase) [Trebouxia sp. C0009 RCD-2024]
MINFMMSTMHRRLKIRTLPDETDIPRFAQELTNKCKLISASKVGRVEQVLHQLVDRETAKPGPSSSRSSASAYVHAFSDVDRQQLRQRNPDRPSSALRQQQQQQQQPPAEHVRFDDLDIYILGIARKALPRIISQENLYEEDVKDKARAANCIATLFRQAQHLEPLLSHATLLPTLARVLRDDGKRSVDLCMGIQSVWLVLSNFSQFHQLLVENQVGVLTIDILDLEIKRTEHRVKEEGVTLRAAAAKEAAGTASDKEQRLLAVSQKQDRLLYLCAYLLLNLSEDPDIERKMQKKGIVVYLVKMLDRTNVELLILATAFLKKLSIYQENKDQMAACDVVSRLVSLMATDNEVLLLACLRLLHNLSFDSGLQEEMIKQGLLPKAVQLVKEVTFQQVALGLLYHISQDDRHKSMFIYTDAVTVILDLLMRVEDLTTTPELIALAVNLTQNSRIAEALCGGERLAMLLERAFLTRDELLFKVLRNLSQQAEAATKAGFLPYLDQLALLLQGPDVDSDLFVEVLGILVNLDMPSCDWASLIAKHDLLNLLAGYAQPGVTEDDILLELVMFMGVVCDEATAPQLVQTGLVSMMYELMETKKEDAEFVLQITHSLLSLLECQATRAVLLDSSQVAFYLIDLLQDSNAEVVKAADQALTVVSETDESWAAKLRALKFEAHNQVWLEACANGAPQQASGDEAAEGESQIQAYWQGGEEEDLSMEDSM